MNFTNFYKKKSLELENNWAHYAMTGQIVTTHSFTNSKCKLNVDNSNVISYLLNGCSQRKG